MMNKNQSIGVHHGARFISSNSIKEYVPGISGIKNTIDQFRRVAYDFNRNFDEVADINKLAPEKFNNTISILGQRGTGKTSTMMTLIKEIKSGRYFTNEIDCKENNIDIIFKIVDPEEMGEGTDFLGWLITTLDRYANELIKQNDNSDVEYCLRISQLSNEAEQIKNIIEELHRSYISSKEEYSKLMYSKSNSLGEYNKKFKDMLMSDFDLHNMFNTAISKIIDITRTKNTINNHGGFEYEPLMFLFLDDVDTSAIHCPSILQDIATFLCHQNIVVCISGDYDVFQKSMTKYFLDSSSYPQKTISKQEISNAEARSEFLLKKVLPPTYRYKTVSYTNEILFNLKYNEEIADKMNEKDLCYSEKFEAYNIYQLISYVFQNGFSDNKDNNEYLKMFIINGENKDNHITKENENIHINYVYAYLSIFGRNVRSFVNVYNYLYIHAIEIANLKTKITAKEYWSIERFSEFINILIESKYTYSQYRYSIKKFLSIKYDETRSEHSIGNNIKNLRIDCEELELLVKQIQNRKEKKHNYLKNDDFPNNKKGEIDALIMLAAFINEMYYAIHKDEYRLRYERIRDKLRKVICNFINSQNDNLQLLPTNLSFTHTLVFYYRVIARMNLNSLQSINEKFIYEDYQRISDLKKYFVQIYYAIILIVTSGINKNEKIYLTSNENVGIRLSLEKNNQNECSEIRKASLYDFYQQSTYKEKVDYNRSSNNSDKQTTGKYTLNRENIEEFIFKQLNKYFKKNDIDWLIDKKVFLDNYCDSFNEIFEEIDRKYFKRLYEIAGKNDKKSCQIIKLTKTNIPHVNIKSEKNTLIDRISYLKKVYYDKYYINCNIEDLKIPSDINSSLIIDFMRNLNQYCNNVENKEKLNQLEMRIDDFYEIVFFKEVKKNYYMDEKDKKNKKDCSTDKKNCFNNDYSTFIKLKGKLVL